MPNIFSEFLPLFNESTETIRARVDADVNAGLSPDDPRWIDTREGSFYYDVTQPVIMEIARLWDALSVEVPASAFLEFAWGQYLDYHAAVFGLVRKPAVAATGEALFAGNADTFIATGTVIATLAPTDSDDDALEFVTTESGTTGAQLAAPTGMSATPSGTGGTLPAGTYYYRATAYNGFGETVGSTETSAATTGTTSKVTVDWADVAGATGYRLYRATVPGGTGVLVYAGAPSTGVDTGGIGGVTGPPTLNTTAGVRLAIEAADTGPDGNVGAGAIVSVETPVAGITYVRNEAATSTGSDVETDAALRKRILLEYGGQGAGTINDYKRWALEHPGIGRVYVAPAGPGAVQVVVMEDDGDAVSGTLVDVVQDDLDPTAGQGAGRAPVGAAVTVETPAVLGITILASVMFKPGYNLDGGGGLTALRSQIEEAIRAYIDGLEVGEDVVYQHVLAQFFAVQGVWSVPALTVNGGTADIAVDDSPPEVAQLASVGLS